MKKRLLFEALIITTAIVAMSVASVLAAYPGPDHDYIVTVTDNTYHNTVSVKCAGYYPTGVHTYDHMYFYGARTDGDIDFSGQMWIDWTVGSSVSRDTFQEIIMDKMSTKH